MSILDLSYDEMIVTERHQYLKGPTYRLSKESQGAMLLPIFMSNTSIVEEGRAVRHMKSCCPLASSRLSNACSMSSSGVSATIG